MLTNNLRLTTYNKLKFKAFWFFVVSCLLLVVSYREAVAVVPVWVEEFDSCTQYQKSHEKFFAQLELKISELGYQARRNAELRDIIKAREDVNKLVATVYNELRTQQVAIAPDNINPDLRNVLQSVGIAVSNPGDTTNGEQAEGTQEICKASYYVKAQVGAEQEQCVAVAQEARLITNQDDYIYEEGRRRAMDTLFCYLGDWRHFPIGKINDPSNCFQVGVTSDPLESCSVQDIWNALSEQLDTQFTDMDGVASPTIWTDDQSVFNLCEGMRALGLKCAQDTLRDYIKYSEIDKITRKDRTVILAPPQTWYTPERCRIIDAFLPSKYEYYNPPKQNTPYTKVIKSITSLLNTSNVTSSFDLTNILFGSKFGNPTITKTPSDMIPSEYTIEKELQAINVPENGFSGLAAKAEALANQIIQEVTELRKLQYANGEGLRDATLRIGWLDYDWEETNSLGQTPLLGKYEALDLLNVDALAKGKKIDPIHPNKIFKPLACYWGVESSTANGCWSIGSEALTPTGKPFYFDTGIVISPISITKSKLQSAIQAQFDLAQKAFKDDESLKIQGDSPSQGYCLLEGGNTSCVPDSCSICNKNPCVASKGLNCTEETSSPNPQSGNQPANLPFGECGAAGPTPNYTIGITLPAPWEDAAVNLSSAINPLTGEPYTYGSPGEFNPPFRIPGINNNYFNFLYNDVFQLYHTPFPDVLAGWFRLDTLAYDSIYGPLETPITFGVSGSPGFGPPGGLGLEGPSGIGSGIGECPPVESGPCSVVGLTASCFGAKGESELLKASAVCNVESGGVPTAKSGSDKCNGGTGPSFSIGLFQVNLTVHDLPGLTACAEPPTEPDTSAFNGKNKSCSIDSQEIYDQCVVKAQDPSISTQKACEILETQGWGAWSKTLERCGFGTSEPVHSECQNNSCIVVNGTGEIACTTDADCTATQI